MSSDFFEIIQHCRLLPTRLIQCSRYFEVFPFILTKKFMLPVWCWKYSDNAIWPFRLPVLWRWHIVLHIKIQSFQLLSMCM